MHSVLAKEFPTHWIVHKGGVHSERVCGFTIAVATR
jgi:hypothetical protein